MDEDQNLDAPEDDNIQEGAEAEVPEDETPDDAEGDEADDADSEGDDDQGDEQEPPARSRANSRIRTLTTREKEAKTRADNAEREVSQLRRQMEEVQRSVQATHTVKDAAAEAELLSQMDPVQRVAYEADKKINALNAEINRVKLSSLDSTDKATFLSKAQNDSVRTRLSAEVEKNLADMRSKGINAPREEIYYYLLGKELVEQKNKSGGKNPDKQAARARIDSTNGRSSSVRSDASSSRKGKTAEERLENMII